MILELLRRLSKEYDRYLMRAHPHLLSTDKAEASELLPRSSSEASDKPLNFTNEEVVSTECAAASSKSYTSYAAVWIGVFDYAVGDVL
jgi:hypothetical protein